MRLVTRIGIGAACIALAVLVYIAGGATRSDRAEAGARDIFTNCKNTPEPALCYETKVPELFPDFTLPDIFSVVRKLRDLDPSYQFCHVLAHKLGEQAVADDPSNWLSLMPLNPPDGLCSNGFVHGVIVGRFRDDVLDDETFEKALPDFKRACEPRHNWRPSGLDQGICYHGMGHLFMFITNADIRKSLDACEQIGISQTGNFLRVCREGVFMQIYQPLEPDDFELIELLPEKPTRENYRRLCGAYKKDEEKGACLREAWPFFRNEILSGDIEQFCSGQPNIDEEYACYESSTTIIGRQLLGDEDRAASACAKTPESFRAMCFISTAQALLEEDRKGGGAGALALCARASPAIADSCTRTLAERAVWLLGDSAERRIFCSQLPSHLRQLCDPATAQ